MKSETQFKSSIFLMISSYPYTLKSNRRTRNKIIFEVSSDGSIESNLTAAKKWQKLLYSAIYNTGMHPCVCMCVPRFLTMFTLLLIITPDSRVTPSRPYFKLKFPTKFMLYAFMLCLQCPTSCSKRNQRNISCWWIHFPERVSRSRRTTRLSGTSFFDIRYFF